MEEKRELFGVAGFDLYEQIILEIYVGVMIVQTPGNPMAILPIKVVLKLQIRLIDINFILILIIEFVVITLEFKT